VKRGLANQGLALAAAPCAYAWFVDAWQVATFTGFAVRLQDDLPGEAWGEIGLSAGGMVVIAAALLVAWQGARAGRWRKAGIALAVAWVASAPVFAIFIRYR
jgi:hypothetical protein